MQKDNVPDLLSANGIWKTYSEFVDARGNTSAASGRTIITIKQEIITIESWVENKGRKIENTYSVKEIKPGYYNFESVNPDLGLQRGTFHRQGNILYSRFVIENTEMNGFEVIIQNHGACNAYGALYDKNILLNSWSAKMKKSDNNVG